MKGKLAFSEQKRRKLDSSDAESVAIKVLNCLTSDPERLGRFLVVTGLDPTNIRSAAREPGFLAAVLDYVMSDEALLLEVAGDAEVAPEGIAAAHARLSPEPDWSP